MNFALEFSLLLQTCRVLGLTLLIISVYFLHKKPSQLNNNRSKYAIYSTQSRVQQPNFLQHSLALLASFQTKKWPASNVASLELYITESWTEKFTNKRTHR
jgi:hypothetical protein